MKCAVHSDADAVGYCRNCGKAMCSQCVRPIRDVLYCEDCLAKTIGLSNTPPEVATGYGSQPGIPSGTIHHLTGNPAAAFLLGLFPGLGAVYNGEYNKALIHITVFAAMIVGLNSDLGDGAITALSLLLAGFILYMAFDAMRTAKAKTVGDVAPDPLEDWSKNRPIGPIILIALGAIFLLENFHLFSFYRVERFWPLVLIAVGVLMFRNRLDRP